MRQRYRLLKDTPTLKKGAIVEENCDDGTQDFFYNDSEHVKDARFVRNYNTWAVYFPRLAVENNPEWFEKVTLVELSVSEIARLGKFLKGR